MQDPGNLGQDLAKNFLLGEELKSKYTQILTKASMELTAANVQHLNRLTTQLDTALTDIEKQLDSQTDTEISSLWKTTQTTKPKNTARRPQNTEK